MELSTLQIHGLYVARPVKTNAFRTVQSVQVSVSEVPNTETLQHHTHFCHVVVTAFYKFLHGPTDSYVALTELVGPRHSSGG
jgi:hypothetical protein